MATRPGAAASAVVARRFFLTIVLLSDPHTRRRPSGRSSLCLPDPAERPAGRRSVQAGRSYPRDGGGPKRIGRGLCFKSDTVAGSPQPCHGRHHGRPAGRDRKSDVEGKSVSVRVDLWGRRIIKKNKKIK